VRGAGAKAPTLIIVGSVVSLHNKLAWFSKPGNQLEGVINKNNQV
jgi:uroporphyrin-III C-methyltransferase/precorrin-2 dehydrogenase/sirohydrochlorin ferrochelatase